MANKYQTSWNLDPLFKSVNDPNIIKTRETAINKSNAFIKAWQLRDDYLKNPAILKKALDDYEAWLKEYADNGNELYYYHLLTALDQNDPKLKAKENKALEISKKIENDIQFFELKLAKVDKAQQKKFLEFKPLSAYKHFLERLFIQSKYLLSEPEEKIMNLKSIPAHANWVKMLSGFLAKEEIKTTTEDGHTKPQNINDLLGLMNSQKKKVRDGAAYAFNRILDKYTDVAEHEMNSILQNKKINDDLRGYPRPDAARHISDDIETEVVDTLIKTVSAHFSIAKRYYKLKAKLMKVPKLAYHERNVEYGKITKKYSYEDGVELIGKVFLRLDSQFDEIFKAFVQEGRVDVFPKKNKTGGAFCTYGLVIHPTYSLLNWTNKLGDVVTFAHELGHGINFELAKKHQNAVNYGTTIATTEVASTFMEDFVLQELMQNADDELKLTLMVMKLNEEVSTIFRQVAFYNFELQLHEEFRKSGYLSKDQIGKIFRKHMISYMGSYVEQSEGSQNWWTYVGHFRNFFYVYSYASGLLISKSLQASVKQNPEFIIKVKKFLSAGLSKSAKQIFSELGIDITNQKFWEKGIREISDHLDETEKLAVRLGKI